MDGLLRSADIAMYEAKSRRGNTLCFFDPSMQVALSTRAQLLAANKTLEEMRDMLEVDSLGFLSIDGLYRAMGETGRNAAAPQFTDHYFTGDYPTRLLDKNGEAMCSKISMLASNG